MKPVAVIAAIAAGLAAIAAGGWYWFSRPADIFAACRSSTTAGATIGGPFELVNPARETVTDKDVITGLTLVYFGYTFCPDVCPADTARNAEAVELLEAQGVMVTPVMITIDPARDTPEAMGEFVSYLHPRMVGLTGSAEQIRTAARAYQVYYAKETAPQNPEFYAMEHTTLTYLMHPDHGFLQFFSRASRPKEMARTIACYADVIANN